MKKILVIEDEVLIRECYVLALEDRGYTTLETPSGKQGISLFQEHHPNIVILDLLMPEMNGEEVYKQIRSINTMCPILIVSASSRSSVRHLFPDDVNLTIYQKPLRIHKLLEYVNSH